MSEESRSTRNLWLEWTGLLLPPIAWALQMQFAYTVVPWACQQNHEWPFHVITLVAVLLALGGGFASWTVWSAVGPEMQNETSREKKRSRFMAILGMMVSAMFALTIIAQGIPSFIFHPCQP